MSRRDGEEMKLLSVDPGGTGRGTTGIVMFDVPDKSPAYVVYRVAVNGGIDGFSAWLDSEFFSMCSTPETAPDVVVCEQFVNRGVHGADLTPVLVEGALRYVMNSWGRGQLVLQPASGKNTLVTDKVLKNYGLWWTDDNHRDQTEAARHGLVYLRSVKHVPTLERMYKE